MIKIHLFLILFATASAYSAEKRIGATFIAGDGISLSEETRTAIGLTMVTVENLPFTFEFLLVAQVYREANEPSQNAGEYSGYTYASSLIPSVQAELIQPGATVLVPGESSITGRILQIDMTMKQATDNAEVLVELPDPDHRWKIGNFIRVKIIGTESIEVTAIPESAVLQTAFGNFVFVQNGASLLRTPVSTGRHRDGFVEVTDGLYSGDEIAASALESLYLIELRATKGGGHSH